MTNLIDPGDIISRSWQNFVTNIRLYLRFGVWLMVLAVVNALLMIITRNMVTNQIAANSLLALCSLPTALVFAAVTAAMIDATAKALQGKPVDERSSIHEGFHRLVPFVWVSILSGLVIVLGFVLLVVPGVLFLVWYRFSQNFTVIDDVRGSAALAASKRLVKGRWGAVFARIALPAIFFAVAATFVTRVLYLIVGAAFGDPGLFFSQSVNLAAFSDLHLLAFNVITQLVNCATIPLLLGADLLLWLDLKRTAGAA